MWARVTLCCGTYALLAAAVFAANPIPDGPGKKILESACVTCHKLDVVVSKKGTWQQWHDVVSGMNAKLTSEESADVVGYLARHFGTKDRGQELVEEICSFCHGLAKLKGQEYTRDQWENVTKGMIFEGAPVTEEEYSLILDYLAKNFGPASEQAKEEK
jgi:cytochrome c5